MWKAIRHYEGLYEVSDTGEVRSLTTTRPHGRGPRIWSGRVLAQKTVNGTGYRSVTLWGAATSKQCYVHRLVLEAFTECNSQLQVNHKDGDKTNNNLDNLEWATPKDNAAHKRCVLKQGAKALTEEQVREIKRAIPPKPRKRDGTFPALAEKYGVHISMIYLIANGKAWGHVGLDSDI